MGLTKFYWALLGFLQDLLGRAGFDWVLPGFTRFYRVFIRFDWVRASLRGFFFFFFFFFNRVMRCGSDG